MTKKQIRQLDKLFSEKIRARGYCEWCGGKSTNLHCAHIFSRRFLHTRWLEENAFALCPRCHRKAHDRPTEFTDFVIRQLGQQRYNQLKLESYRLSIGEDEIKYEEILKKLKGEK